jgi:hypothetical protein
VPDWLKEAVQARSISSVNRSAKPSITDLYTVEVLGYEIGKAEWLLRY